MTVTRNTIILNNTWTSSHTSGEITKLLCVIGVQPGPRWSSGAKRTCTSHQECMCFSLDGFMTLSARAPKAGLFSGYKRQVMVFNSVISLKIFGYVQASRVQDSTFLNNSLIQSNYKNFLRVHLPRTMPVYPALEGGLSFVGETEKSVYYENII